MGLLCRQFSAIVCHFFTLQFRNVSLIISTLFTGAFLSIVLPQTELTVTSGFLTLIYTCFVWVNGAMRQSLRDRESRYKHLLLSNGLNICVYNLGFLLVETVLCLIIVLIGGLLHTLSSVNSWTFYYEDISVTVLMVGLFGYGMSYLALVLLVSQICEDYNVMLLVTMIASNVQFCLFPTHEEKNNLAQTKSDYFYFGYNRYVPQVHNFYVAYALAFLCLLVYLVVELNRYSRSFRYCLKSGCSARRPHRRVRRSDSTLSCPLAFQDQQVVRIQNVSKFYGSTRALSKVSFKLFRNEICCIVGKNCSGKSTLLRILSGFESMSSGSICFNSEEHFVRHRELSLSGEVFDFKGIGYCAQENNLPPNLTCSEIFDFFYHFKGGRSSQLKKSKQRLTEQIGLTHHLSRKYRQLSVGMKRKFSLLLSLILDPSFILMDEPVSGLDIEFQQQFWELVGQLKENRTIVVVSHEVNPAASYADRCLILDQGEVVHYLPFSELVSSAQGLIKIKTRIKQEFVTPELSAQDCYNEYIVLSDDLERVEMIIQRHPHSHIFLSTISLQEMILYFSSDQQSRFQGDTTSIFKKKIWNQLLRQEMSKFEGNQRPSWCRQVWVLYLRRTQLLWQKPRNLMAVVFIFILIVVEWAVMGMSEQFVPYRLLIALSTVAVEQSLQNLTSFKLLLRLSGVSTLQQQISTLMANFTLFTLIYFLLFLLLCIYNTVVDYQSISETSFILFAILGTFANMSFTQFVALVLSHFLDDPNVVLIVFDLFVSYFLVFLFRFSLYPAFVFPTLLSSYALSRSAFRVSSDTNSFYYAELQNYYMIAFFLIIQALFYLLLAFFLDFILDRNCSQTLSVSDSTPVEVKVKKSSQQVIYNFKVPQGHICCLFGPPQSGKSELVRLLSQKGYLFRKDFKGHCRVLGANILSGQQLGGNTLGVCLEDDDLEESFTLFEHLWFLGSLKGLSGDSLYSQIFFVAKLLDLEGHLFKKISHLSGGTKRKASISTTLLGGPALIIIDEATKNLDPAVIQQLLLALHYFVHRLGRTLIFTSKKMEELIMISDETLELKPSQPDEVIHCDKREISEWLKIKIIYTPRKYFNSIPWSKSSHTLSEEMGEQGEDDRPKASSEYAVTFSMSQLKEELVVFLREIAQKEARIARILLTD